ncbi:MAG: hypothetical protein R3F56_05950 [Planctomycetota bacterium]
MSTNEPDNKPPVAGRLRSSFGDDEPPAPPAKRPGSSVFNRMPPPPAPPPPPEPEPSRAVEIPAVRRRWRPSGVFFPLLIVAMGVATGQVLLETTRSLPIAIVCWVLGLVGAIFCRILLRDRVEIG